MQPEILEEWQREWREHIAPRLTRAQLQILADGLAHDDRRICQGCTCVGIDTSARTGDPPILGACAIAYVLWESDPLIEDIHQLKDRFFDFTDTIGDETGIEIPIPAFLRWFDTTPRAAAFPALLAEVRRSLQLQQVNE